MRTRLRIESPEPSGAKEHFEAQARAEIAAPEDGRAPRKGRRECIELPAAAQPALPFPPAPAGGPGRAATGFGGEYWEEATSDSGVRTFMRNYFNRRVIEDSNLKESATTPWYLAR